MKSWTKSFKRQSLDLLKVGEGFLKKTLLFFVGLYRTFGSQFLGGQCRFYPSCSHYAAEALKTHSVSSAFRLITLRILRCHPLGSSGWDPVPARKETLNARKQSATEAF